MWRPTPPVRSALSVVAFLGAVSLWIGFWAVHEDPHSDSIVPILCSLYHWTPFFWAEDRFGMLLPLIASPIKNPMANLLFEDAMSAFLGFSTFVLMARALLPEDRDWALAAGISGGLFI